MGYWAKDGSYQRDDSDIQTIEAMNETYGQRYDRLNITVINSGSPFTQEEAQSKEDRRKAYEAAKNSFKRYT